MAEHWKSTPKYWCKHCLTYVRDTKLERQNHEATGKHQGAVRRSLRDLHRGKEQEEREKERARREIERLNGVVSGSGGPTTTTTSSSSSSSGAGSRGAGAGGGGGPAGGVLSESERKRQAEQLASLGVSIPQEFRGDLAMVGEWTVTSTTVVEEKPPGGGDDDVRPEARARGVHKRERTDEEKEEEDAVRGLFKKPRRWGRDSKTAAGGGDGEGGDLDALLSGGLVVKKKDEDDAGGVKEEEGAEASATAKKGQENGAKREADEDLPFIKKEPSDGEDPIPADVSAGAGGEPEVPAVKAEEGEAAPGHADTPPVVTFKKRKPKNIRQK